MTGRHLDRSEQPHSGEDPNNPELNEITKYALFDLIKEKALAGKKVAIVEGEPLSHIAHITLPDGRKKIELIYDPPETGWELAQILLSENLPSNNSNKGQIILNTMISIEPGPNGLVASKLLSKGMDEVSQELLLHQVRQESQLLSDEEVQDMIKEAAARISSQESNALYDMEEEAGLHLVSEEEALEMIKLLNSTDFVIDEKG